MLTLPGRFAPGLDRTPCRYLTGLPPRVKLHAGARLHTWSTKTTGGEASQVEGGQEPGGRRIERKRGERRLERIG